MVCVFVAYRVCVFVAYGVCVFVAAALAYIIAYSPCAPRPTDARVCVCVCLYV